MAKAAGSAGWRSIADRKHCFCMATLAIIYAEPTTSASFKDVKAKDWFKKSVDWAVENGITSGYGQGTFSPNVTCNRAMMVAFLKKVAELPKV